MGSSKETLEQLLSPEQRRLDAMAEKRAKFNNYMAIAILLILVAMWAWAFMRTAIEPKIQEVAITDVRIEGNQALCPGDTLVLVYEFRASGVGKLIEDQTIWIETPPKTVVYSDEYAFLVEGTIEQTTRLAWTVPATYINPATDKIEPLPPGEYRRIFSVSSVSRPAVFAIASVEFEILDCSEAGKLQTGPGEWGA